MPDLPLFKKPETRLVLMVLIAVDAVAMLAIQKWPFTVIGLVIMLTAGWLLVWHWPWASDPEIRSRRWGLLFVWLVVVLFVGNVAWPVEPTPIAVSPSVFNISEVVASDFPDSSLQGRVTLNVYNRSDNPYYQISIEIMIDAPPPYLFLPQHLDLDFPTIQQRIRSGEREQTAAVGAFCWRVIKKDEQRRSGFACTIDKIPPRSNFEIKVTSKCYWGGGDPITEIPVFVTINRYLPAPEPGMTADGPDAAFRGTKIVGDYLSDGKLIVFCPKRINDADQPNDTMICTPDSVSPIK